MCHTSRRNVKGVTLFVKFLSRCDIFHDIADGHRKKKLGTSLKRAISHYTRRSGRRSNGPAIYFSGARAIQGRQTSEPVWQEPKGWREAVPQRPCTWWHAPTLLAILPNCMWKYSKWFVVVQKWAIVQIQLSWFHLWNDYPIIPQLVLELLHKNKYFLRR